MRTETLSCAREEVLHGETHGAGRRASRGGSRSGAGVADWAFRRRVCAEEACIGSTGYDSSDILGISDSPPEPVPGTQSCQCNLTQRAGDRRGGGDLEIACSHPVIQFVQSALAPTVPSEWCRGSGVDGRAVGFQAFEGRKVTDRSCRGSGPPSLAVSSLVIRGVEPQNTRADSWQTFITRV